MILLLQDNLQDNFLAGAHVAVVGLSCGRVWFLQDTLVLISKILQEFQLLAILHVFDLARYVSILATYFTTCKIFWSCKSLRCRSCNTCKIFVLQVTKLWDLARIQSCKSSCARNLQNLQEPCKPVHVFSTWVSGACASS